MTDWALIVVFSCLILGLTMAARGPERAFLGILSFTHFFYCVFGLLFWTQGRLGYFVGFYWPIDMLYQTGLYVTLSNFALASLICGYSWVARPVDIGQLNLGRSDMRSGSYTPPFPYGVYGVFVAIGVLCSLFVLSRGSFASIGSNRGGLFLIAYQFSDILIPVTCFWIIRRGFTWASALLILYFLFYASLVGFRYKIALLVLPLMLLMICSDMRTDKKAMLSVAVGLFVFALFSMLTLFRVKFGLPDFTRSLDNGMQEVVYGVFAEANTIFGMTAVQTWFVEGGVTYGLTPFRDAILEMIPRFLMPGRVTGEYLLEVGHGMISQQGAESGTAYFWVGEFCIMFGWAGYLVGPVFMLGAYALFRNMSVRLGRSKKDVAMALFLVSGVMAYYHFSRGYFPQIFKSYIFVILPYFYLSVSHRLVYFRTAYS